MSAQNKKALVVNNRDYFEQFHDNLKATLELLKCDTKIISNWKDACRELANGLASYDMLILDPYLDDFDSDYVWKNMSRIESDVRPKLIGVELLPEENSDLIKSGLPVDAVIAKSYTPHELAFIFNRFVFPMTNNMRKHPRALSAAKVEVFVDGNEKALEEETFSLSLGGAFVKCYDPPPRGASLEALLYIPGGKNPINFKASVVYSRRFTIGAMSLVPAGMGVCFEPLAEEDLSRLGEFVKRCLAISNPTLTTS